MQLTKKEIKRLLIASLIAGLVFSFTEWGITQFNLTIGLLNLIRAIIISSLVYTIHALSQKLIAQKSCCGIEFKLITAKKIPYPRGEIKLPKFLQHIGPIITLLVSIISNGKLFFIALASFEPKLKRKLRVGHKWVNIKEYEEATIAFAGPISNLLLLVIFKLLQPLAAPFFTKAIFITSTLAIFHLLPFPKFDGLKILIGSKFLYLFSITLAIILIGIVNFVNVFLAILLALIVATSLTLYFFYYSKK
jgi:Zn-dependent protease